MHEQIIELVDSRSWYDNSGEQIVLEDISLVCSATLESGVHSVLSDRFISRFNYAFVGHPSEDSFNKIFSSVLGLRFKVCSKKYIGLTFRNPLYPSLCVGKKLPTRSVWRDSFNNTKHLQGIQRMQDRHTAVHDNRRAASRP